MKNLTLFYCVCICLLSKSVLCSFVKDLSPNTNCDAVLASKADERKKDPTLMDKKADYVQCDPNTATSIHDFTVKDTYLYDRPLSECKGYVTLIVNIASSCGLTQSNYDQLTQMKQQYGNQLRIILFPCNQFAHQMPEGDGDEMLCHFKPKNADPGDVMAKSDVNGEKELPLYTFLKTKLPNGPDGPEIEWNFAKFLCDKNGIPVKRFASKTEPKDMINDINELMKQ